MRLFHAISSVLFLCTVSLLASCNRDLEVVQSIDERFSGVEKIEVESGFLTVTYQGDPSLTEVSLKALLESSHAGRFTLTYELKGSTLHVELEQTRTLGGGNHRGVINLTGPEAIKLDVDSGSGEVLIEGISSSLLKVDSGSGSLGLNRIMADQVELEVGSGSITVHTLTGNVKAEASSGNMVLEQISGGVWANTSSGNIQIKGVTKRLDAASSSGNLELADIMELGSLKTSSGKINAENAGLGPNTTLNSASGSIKIQTFSDLSLFNYNLSSASGRIVVGGSSSAGSLVINNGAPHTVTGSVASGSIEIRN